MYTTLGKSQLPCCRILNGLWQTSGSWGTIVPAQAVAAMAELTAAGFTSFDGADHYGPAEALMGGLRAHLTASAPPTAACAAQCFTKWCPQPRAHTAAEVAAALDRSCSRMQTPTLDLLQLHWWGACVCGAGGPRRSRGWRRAHPFEFLRSLSHLSVPHPPTHPPRPPLRRLCCARRAAECAAGVTRCEAGRPYPGAGPHEL